MGANDACTKTEAEMTPVADFRTRADSALTDLAGKGVKQVVVASIPDVYKLWQVGKGSSSARFVWGLYGICQSMLKSPSSSLKADQDRRLRVQKRVVDFNTELQRACSAIATSSTTMACKFDDNAVFNTSFALNDISKVDYFHPSVSGQALLAQKMYIAAGF